MFAVYNARVIHSFYLGRRRYAIIYISYYDDIIFTIRVLLLLFKFQKFFFLWLKISLPFVNSRSVYLSICYNICKN